MGGEKKSIHQFIIDEEYARLRARTEAEAALRKMEAQREDSQDALIVSFEELLREEAELVNEKASLLRVKQGLVLQFKKQIENRRAELSSLKDEILELRRECQVFEQALERLKEI